MKTGKLFLIPTPINNEDMKDILLQSDIERVINIKYFIVETPKNARHNLGTLPLNNKMQDIQFEELSEHTKEKDIKMLLQPLLEGNNTGLMSDAGLPSIADPGFRLVKAAQEADIEVIPLTGPSSIFLALMASGLNGQNFAFNGYLPKDITQLKNKIKFLENLAVKIDQTQIFMDTPYRNQKLYESIIEVCSPSTLLCIAFNIGNDNGYIKTKKIFQWRKEKIILGKSPCLFLLNKS